MNLLDDIKEIICLEIEKVLQNIAVPEFWKNFGATQNQRDVCAKRRCEFQIFRDAVAQLYRRYQSITKILQRLKFMEEKAGNKFFYRFDEVFKSNLLAQLPPDFVNVVHSFYYVSFKVFINNKDENDDEDEFMEEKEECNGCGLSRCQCQEFVNAFTEVNISLSRMGLLDRISGYTLTELIQDEILDHIQKICRGNFDVQHMKSLEKWLDVIVMEWLTRIYNNGFSKVDPSNVKIRDSISYFQMKLKYFLFEKYANIIIEQFFNIIIEFPDSQPAIDDLKLCMEKLDLRSHLVETLKTSLETRLLHQGVDTNDIITGYVATIKAMRHLEKNGILLQTVTEPVKEYLRKCRTDTVRCVVTSLIEDTPSDLAEELARSEIQAEENERNQDEMNNWQNWNPDPIDALESEKSSPQNRKSDIISMIVDIYGSKELFVNEYRNLLAERLLTQLDFNAEKEIRNLELLKLRFGESLLHNCEVMLKDISDSKRINAHILESGSFAKDSTKEDPSVSALIVSSQFWPAFKKETMEFPEEINNVFERYKKSFEEYKGGNRTLFWTPLNGKVTIEIEINDKKTEMTVTPAQATILMHFQSQKEWHLDKLSSVIQMPSTVLKRRIGFWQIQGIIRETKENFYVLCDDETGDSSNSHANVMMDEGEEVMVSSNDQREEELQVFWNYIVGMLTNLDNMALERIHQMLKLFASQAPGFEFSIEELKAFLQKKVREHKLNYIHGVYQLPKH